MPKKDHKRSKKKDRSKKKKERSHKRKKSKSSRPHSSTKDKKQKRRSPKSQTPHSPDSASDISAWLDKDGQQVITWPLEGEQLADCPREDQLADFWGEDFSFIFQARVDEIIEETSSRAAPCCLKYGGFVVALMTAIGILNKPNFSAMERTIFNSQAQAHARLLSGVVGFPFGCFVISRKPKFSKTEPKGSDGVRFFFVI